MKHILLFFVGFCFATICNAQNINSLPKPDSLKVNLLKDSMSVTYNGRHVPLHNTQQLDSFMKKIPNPKQLKVDFASENADDEKRRHISKILDQCNCEIIRSSKSFLEYK